MATEVSEHRGADGDWPPQPAGGHSHPRGHRSSRHGDTARSMTRRPRGRIVVAVIFSLFALNAWAQVADNLIFGSSDPATLTLLQALVGSTALLAALGSWWGAPWAPAAALAYGVATAVMLVLLGPLLDLRQEETRGVWMGAMSIALLSVGLAWYLRRSIHATAAESSAT